MISFKTDGINKPEKIYYNLAFYKETKTSFGYLDNGQIVDQIYFLITNGAKIPEDKFDEISKAIYKILNT